MTEPTPAIDLSDVSRHFRSGLWRARKQVLSEIELQVAAGTTAGLVGPNGSGKSTLLRLLAGIDRPSGGRVRVLGGDPLSAGTRRRIAYVPEDSPFPPEWSPLTIMDLFAALQGLPRQAARETAHRRLEQVGLGAELKTPLRRFSRGMLRRFGLAQAFLGEPEVVLLDEPTAGLDAQGFGVLEELLDEARRKATTVILASHLLHDIHDHCERLLLMVNGRALARDVRELLETEGQEEFQLAGLTAATRVALDEYLAQQGIDVVDRRPVLRSLGQVYSEHAARSSQV